MEDKQTAKRESQYDLAVIAKSVDEVVELTKSLTKDLQEETLESAKIRIELQKDIEHLRETVDELRTMFIGNGHPSIAIQLSLLNNRVQTIETRCQSIQQTKQEHAKEADDRLWKFFLNNSPVIITWIGLLIYFVIKLIFQHQPPTPTL